MKKANVRISVSGIKNSLMHLEARKDTHPNETLFVTWAKVSDDKFLYSWQLMHQDDGEIKAADSAANPVSHDELGRNIERLVQNTFIDNTFQAVDQDDYLLNEGVGCV